MTIDELSHRTIGLAIEVHKALGPGLLENTYKQCLFYKLNKDGLFTEKEKPIPVVFEEVQLECGYKIDILVEKQLVLELKAVEALTDVHLAQTLTYLKLGGYHMGLLINFNVFLLKDGIKRIKNGYLK